MRWRSSLGAASADRIATVSTIAVVQARMTSTRLPGKVLLDLAGRPMLERQLERLGRSERLDEIVLAVTTNPDDDPLIALADRLGLRWYRGSEHDVLDRYAGAVRASGGELVVRITSDCPLIDAAEVDVVIRELTERRATHDYASNSIEPTLPRGLDCEAFWADVLERMARMATSAAAREHVTWFCYGERPDLFTLHSVVRPFDAFDLRWTVDTADDLALVRRLYDDLELADHDAGAPELIAYVRAHPELAQINAHVPQKDAAV
jgi:spore coat polysaccharide biosynthesis protein SpsF